MNQCIFVGRLTGDPEIWIAENEARTVIGKMHIAVDRKVKKDMEKKVLINLVLLGGRFSRK